MPKTDVTEERGLSRLQGIDLREHADQNVAHDCVNLRLDNASRLVPYPRPTKVKSGSFTFACESKDPALQEFDFSLAGYFGAPTVTTQETYSGGTMTKINGTNLGSVNKIILVAEDGTCLESGQDFYYDYSGTSLLLNVYWSEYAKFESVVLYTPYGVLTFAVDVTVRTSKTLYLGGADSKTFKVGVDSVTHELCVWQKANGKWEKVASYGSPSAKPWVEGAELKDEREYLSVSASEGQKWVFAVRGSNPNERGLKLGFYAGFPSAVSDLANAVNVQSWGATASAEPTWSGDYVEEITEYRLGSLETYRFYAPYGEHKIYLQMKSDSNTNNYDITLMEWDYEE